MGWRNWLARKLDPVLAIDADKYHYLNSQLDDVRQWCSYDFPVAGKAVNWAMQRVYIHYLPLDDFHELVSRGGYGAVQVGGISEFRDKLRAEHGPQK